jgi:cell wall-associated NlpC family hydrolase
VTTNYPVKRGRIVAAGLLALTLSSLTTPAQADPSSRTLQAQADTLRSQVEQLRLQQSIATEAYDTAVSETEQAVSAEVRAQSAVDAATGASSTATADATRRVRSLYMAGGSLPTGLSRVLASGDLTQLDDAARSARIAESVVADDASTVAAAADARADAQSAEDELARVRETKTAAQAAARAAKEQLTTALDQQQTLLADADTAVAQAVAREEEQARQAALAAAQSQASTAGVADAVAGASSTAEAAIAAAWTREGMSYVWGATGPTTFDCSGLTQWAYAQAGISIPRTSRQQYAGLPKVPLDQLQPGDLVFYANGSDPSSIHHVALYLGGGKVLHAPHTGDVVREAGVAMSGLYGAVRPS